jgi:hypothetical protein
MQRLEGPGRRAMDEALLFFNHQSSIFNHQFPAPHPRPRKANLENRNWKLRVHRRQSSAKNNRVPVAMDHGEPTTANPKSKIPPPAQPPTPSPCSLPLASLPLRVYKHISNALVTRAVEVRTALFAEGAMYLSRPVVDARPRGFTK